MPGGAPLEQLLDAIVRGRAIDVGEHVGSLRQQVTRRAERGLPVVVTEVRAGATALRDLAPFPSREERFLDDLTPFVREVLQVTAKDAIELFEVVLGTPLRGRRRVVLAMVTELETRNSGLKPQGEC